MKIRSMLNLFRDYGPSRAAVLFANAGKYLFCRNLLRKKYFTRRIFDYSLLLDTADPGICKTLAIHGERELEHRYILSRVLSKGMRVLDCGANIGYYVMMEAGFTGPSGKVYAVEPLPSNVTLLKMNLAFNRADTAEVFEMAMSDADGCADFFVSQSSNLSTMHDRNYRGKDKNELTGKRITVKTAAAKDFVRGKDIGLIRMDIEGHEVEVMGSLAEAAEKGDFSGAILFETHFRKYDDKNHSMRAPLKRLFALGYRAAYMASNDEQSSRLKEFYRAETVIRTDGVQRGVYRDVSDGDAERFICEWGGVRTVLLARKT